jgi:hypothetical protein
MPLNGFVAFLGRVVRAAEHARSFFTAEAVGAPFPVSWSYKH